jgi:hypothetical protein
VVLSPNKQTIYPGNLPERIRKMKGGRTRADQLEEISRELEIPYLDLRPVLLEAVRRHPVELYHRLGTHWNQLGGFIAYTRIMEEIGKRFPLLQPVPASDFRLAWSPVSTEAGCADIMGIRGTVPEGCYLMRPVFQQLNDIPAEDYTQKYVEYDTRQPGGLKLLAFRDSFSSVLVRYLAPHFSRSAFVWQFRVDFSTVDRESPDIVLLQFAERYSGEFLR